MDSMLDVRPLSADLAELAASYCLDEDLCKLLSHMDNESATAALTMEWGEEAFYNAATAEEDGDVSLSPTPISSAASVTPSTFAAWDAQGPNKLEKIRDFNDYLEAADENNIGKLLCEVSLNKYVREVTFSMCVDKILRWVAPHVVPLHGLGAGPCF